MTYESLKKLEEKLIMIILGLLALFLPFLAFQVFAGNLTNIVLVEKESEARVVSIVFLYLSRVSYLLAQRILKDHSSKKSFDAKS